MDGWVNNQIAMDGGNERTLRRVVIMAQGNSMIVTLRGDDKLSGVFSRAATAGVVAGNMITAAFSAVGNMVSKVGDTFGNMVKSASDTQMDLIGSAGALVDVLGQPFEKTLGFAKQLNSEFVQLGAKLPGTAEDFAQVGRSVSDDIIAAFKGADGTVDLPNAKKTLMDLTEGWTLLAQQSKTSASDAGQLLGRLIGGDINTLKMAMFDRSPAFKNALDKVLKADGKTREDWEKATTKQRAEWLKEATRLTIPKEAIAAMSNTVDGLMAGWKSAIFDPTTGVLGMLRVLSNRGGKTAMDALFALLKASEDFFSELVRLFPFKGDIMLGLFDLFTNLTQVLQIAKGYLTEVKDAGSGLADGAKAMAEMGLDALTTGLQRLPDLILWVVDKVTDVATSWQGQVNKMLPNLSGILGKAQQLFTGVVGGVGDWLNSLFADLMPALAGATNTAVNVSRSVLGSIDWGQLGQTIGKGFVSLLTSVTAGIMTYLANLDIGNIINLIGDILKGVWAFIDGLGQGVRNSLVSGLQTGVGTLAGLVGQLITGWISQVSSGLTGMIGNVVSATVSGVGRVGVVFSQSVLRIVDGFTQFGSSVVNAITSALSGTVNSIVSKAGEMATGLVNAFTQFFSNLLTSLQSQITNIGASVGSAVSSAASNVSNAASSAVNAVTGNNNSTATTPTSTTPAASTSTKPANSQASNSNPDPGLLQQPGVRGARATGWLMPLAKALSSERQNMPSDAGIVIANSSEAILNRNQQHGLARALMPKSPTVNQSSSVYKTYSPQVSVVIQAADDPQTTADYVINELARLYAQFEATV